MILLHDCFLIKKTDGKHLKRSGKKGARREGGEGEVEETGGWRKKSEEEGEEEALLTTEDRTHHHSYPLGLREGHTGRSWTWEKVILSLSHPHSTPAYRCQGINGET